MIKKFMLSMSVISAFLAASAEKVTVGELYYEIDTEKNVASVYSTKNASGDIEIPPEVEYQGKNYTVTAIGEMAFGDWMNERDITSVTIPSTVTTIGERAFQNTKITQISIPTSVKSIGAYAFYKCNKLSSISLPGTVETIGTGVFSSCEALESAVLGEGIKAIPAYMFTLCHKLSSVTLPSTLEEFLSEDLGATVVGQSFAECASLTSIDIPTSVKEIAPGTFRHSGLKTITIPDACTKIGANTFESCYNLESIKLPENLTDIEGGMFAYCRSLKEINIPNSVIEIGSTSGTYGCFDGCISLTKVEFGKSLKVISHSAFYGCPLNDVVFPESLETIKSEAFYGCNSLTKVNIGKNVSEIGRGAFAGCQALQGFNVSPENAHYSSHDGLLYDKSMTAIHAVPATVNGPIDLPVGLKTICDGAFDQCDKITSITLHGNVDSIGLGAFSGCTCLTEINVSLDNKYYSSENGILYNAGKTELIIMPHNSKITDLTLPTTVRDIAPSSLSGSKIRTIQLPDGLKTIGDDAFSMAESLISVAIPNSVESIGQSTFRGCRSLTTAKLPANMTVIPESMFNDCPSLTSVELPENLVEIGNFAFNNTGLESISLQASITQLGYSALPSQIKKIFMYNPVPPAGTSFIQLTDNRPTAYVPAGCINAYKSQYPWNMMTLKELPDDNNRVLHIMCAPSDNLWNGDILRGELSENMELNTTYTITMKVKGSKPSTDSTQPLILKAKDNLQTPIAVDTKWSEFSTDFSADNTWYASQLEIYIASYDGDLYIDDVTLTKKGDDKNLLRNGDFDTLRDEGWSLYNSNGSTMDVVIDNGTSTGIETIGPGIATEKRWRVHSLSGMLIMDTADRNDLSKLSRGIYIINGKKVLVK